MKRSLCVLSLALFAACSPKSESSSSVPASESPAAAGEASTTLTLTQADIDGFEKGLKREIEIVKDGQERAKVAKTPVERGNAIQSTFEENTMKGAVDVSGLSFERYHLVRSVLAKIFTTLDFQGKIDGPQSVDTTLADSAMKARLASDPYSALDPAGAELLKSRLNEIAPVWIEYINLTVAGG